MKKLRLTADDLRVDSFPTARAAAETEGTVQGFDISNSPTFCYEAMCPPPSTRTCPFEKN